MQRLELLGEFVTRRKRDVALGEVVLEVEGLVGAGLPKPINLSLREGEILNSVPGTNA